MFAFEPDAPMTAGLAVAGVVGDVVEAVVRTVPEAVTRVDGGAGGRMFGQGVLDFPDLEVGFAKKGGGVADFVQGVAEDGDVLAEVDFVFEDLVPALAAAGDHAGAGGHADGGAGVGAAERTPRAARASRWGVRMAGLPAQRRVSQRCWSVVMKRKFGGWGMGSNGMGGEGG